MTYFVAVTAQFVSLMGAPELYSEGVLQFVASNIQVTSPVELELCPEDQLKQLLKGEGKKEVSCNLNEIFHLYLFSAEAHYSPTLGLAHCSVFLNRIFHT